MAVTIRDAGPADAEAIANLLSQLGYPIAAGLIPARLERLAIVGDRIVVAEVDGEVAGLAHLQVTPTIEHDRPVAKLGALVVEEPHRGTGVGRALVDALEVEARERGCGIFFLTTADHRDDAHLFYERVGFAHTGRRYSRTLSQ